MLETMTQLEYLNLSGIRHLEELPRHITNQASLRDLHFRDAERLREIPANIGQLSKLQTMYIGSKLLESLPTSIGDLSSLSSLQISYCPKLGCLPESLGRLNHLKELTIQNSGVKSLANVVRKTSISEDCCPGLESLSLIGNSHLTEIDVLPTTLKRNIRSIDGLVNIQTLHIIGCPELDSLPSFAQLACLQYFVLGGCHGVKKIHGLEHCRALERLRVHTRWEEAGIQSLERMERLREVSLKAISRAGVEGCIQSMQNLQRWPERIRICTRVVSDAASLLNSFDFSNLSVVDSFDNWKIDSWSRPWLKVPSSARCILVCFVLNCESPKASLNCGSDCWNHHMELEEGKWVWTSVVTQHSKIHNNQSMVQMYLGRGEFKGEVEKGLFVTGEEGRVVEAFTRLCMLLSD